MAKGRNTTIVAARIPDTLSQAGVTVLIASVGLIVAIGQIKLSRVAVERATNAIDDARKERAVQAMGKEGSIIHVEFQLTRWQGRLSEARDIIKEALSTGDLILLKDAAKLGEKKPDGLVWKGFYDNAPDWLVAILMSGAQYYYDAAAPLVYLWNDDNGGAQPVYADTFQRERLAQCMNALTELKTYVAGALPGVFYETPASLNDKDFLTK